MNHKGWGNLKKYAVFLISFVLSYLAYQIFTGWILTALYIPNFSLMNNTSSQEVLLVGQNYSSIAISYINRNNSLLYVRTHL